MKLEQTFNTGTDNSFVNSDNFWYKSTILLGRRTIMFIFWIGVQIYKLFYLHWWSSQSKVLRKIEYIWIRKYSPFLLYEFSEYKQYHISHKMSSSIGYFFKDFICNLVMFHNFRTLKLRIKIIRVPTFT